MSGPGMFLSLAEAEEAATEVGCLLVVPTDYELALDYDDVDLDAAVERFYGMAALDSLCAAVRGGEGTECFTISRNGKGMHIYVRLWFPVALAERVALQAALGSDPVREALSVMRLWAEESAPLATVMFETPEGAAEVAKWRAKYPDEGVTAEEWREILVDLKPQRGIRLREEVA